MPTPETRREYSNEHIQEAKENYERYLRLLNDDRGLDIDWALVALFYSALHLVQAHAERHAKQLNVAIPNTHKGRDEDGGRDEYVNKQLSDIYVAYNKLKGASEDARYKRVKRSKEQVEDLCDSLFEPIRSHLAGRHIHW